MQGRNIYESSRMAVYIYLSLIFWHPRVRTDADQIPVFELFVSGYLRISWQGNTLSGRWIRTLQANRLWGQIQGIVIHEAHGPLDFLQTVMGPP